MIHTVKGFSIVSEAEVDVFLEFSCFSNDPVDVGNLISDSSAFSKSSLNIWKFKFLKRSLVFPILLFSFISLRWSLMKAFLSLLAILWNSTFRWVYHSFSPLPFAFFSAICKASSDKHFTFLHFFLWGMVLITTSCIMLQTSVHSSSGTLSIRSNPLNLFLTSTA